MDGLPPLLRIDSQRHSEKQEGHYDGEPHDHPSRAVMIALHVPGLPNL
jgi:hypothetical protein